MSAASKGAAKSAEERRRLLRGKSSAPSPKSASVPSSLRGHILIVDDEPAICRVMVRLLQPWHEVVTAASGAEAQAIVASDPSFDVILCDLMMPGMTGMDVYSWLLAQHPSLAERVVFLTGGACTADETRYLAGIENIKLEKPCESATLIRVVSELVALNHTVS